MALSATNRTPGRREPSSTADAQPRRWRPVMVTTVDADSLLYIDGRIATAPPEKPTSRGAVVDDLVRRAGGEDRERGREESRMRHGIRGQINIVRLNLAVLRLGCDQRERARAYSNIETALRRMDGLLPVNRGESAPPAPEYEI